MMTAVKKKKKKKKKNWATAVKVGKMMLLMRMLMMIRLMISYFSDQSFPMATKQMKVIPNRINLSL